MFLRIYTGVTTWWSDLKMRSQEEKGATAVEHALMVALIAVVIIAAVAFLGHAASNKFSTGGSGVKKAGDHRTTDRPPSTSASEPGVETQRRGKKEGGEGSARGRAAR